jgi:hypothetical protein
MTKVEEARASLFNAVNPHTFLNDGELAHYEDDPTVTVLIDSLIVAVEEQTKETIRKAGEFVRENASIPNGKFISESLSIGREVLLYADCDLFIIPASSVILDSEEES